MKDQFVTYNQALALKELGFDEPCFGAFDTHQLNTWLLNILPYQVRQYKYGNNACIAPLKSQIFKWFRDKHKLYAEIDLDSYQEPYSLKVTIKKMDPTNTYVEEEFYPYANGIGDIDNDKYEEAESECIDKLISILKEKK